jgi:hypothetical protein
MVIVIFMRKFPMEAVGGRRAKILTMPSQTRVNEILEGLWMICLGETSEAGFDWGPDSEFRFRERTSEDRIFRVKDFEGRSERIEHDGNPGCGGIDLLGKYSLSDSTITIYVDSCRKAARKYYDGSSLEELIEVVLIHELAHLITHRGYGLEFTNEKESDHLWEYTAQCATYSYLKKSYSNYSKEYLEILYGLRVLEIFERLSSHQPFIYRTWEVYRTWEGLGVFHSDHSRVEKFMIMVNQIQTTCALTTKPEPVPEPVDMLWMTGYDS